jgi:hypothetical protein
VTSAAAAKQSVSLPLFAEAAQRLSQLVGVAGQVRAEKDTDIAGDLIKAAARKIGVDPEAFCNLSAETENGDRIYISSDKIGSGQRFAIAVQLKGNDVIRFATGCFRGPMDDFTASVIRKYPSGEIAEQYTGFIRAAKDAFASRDPLPSLPTTVSACHQALGASTPS